MSGTATSTRRSIPAELWETANSVLAGRTPARGGRRPVHGYSGLVWCACGMQMYRRSAERGREFYRCARGRRNVLQEERCGNGSTVGDATDAAVDRLMRRMTVPERVTVTTGGDTGRQMELSRIQDEMSSAMSRKDMVAVTRLAGEFSEVEAMPSEPIQTVLRETGRTMAGVWGAGDLSDRRALLGRGEFRIVARQSDDGWRVVFVWEGNDERMSKSWRLTGAVTARQVLWDREWDAEPLVA